MSDTNNVFRWKDIEIFGYEVPNFAAHTVSVYTPLLYTHFGLLLIFSLSFIWILYGYYQLNGQAFDNSKFSKIFVFLFTPSAVLTCLSGAYLYYVSYVIFSNAPHHLTRGLAYCGLAAIYGMSMIFMMKRNVIYKTSAFVLSGGVFALTLLLIISYFGAYHG